MLSSKQVTINEEQASDSEEGREAGPANINGVQMKGNFGHAAREDM
jgi:hypothetical protein